MTSFSRQPQSDRPRRLRTGRSSTVDRHRATALALGGALLLVSGAATAKPAVHAKAELWRGYSEHPTVSKVRATGFLTVLDRERALSARTPPDRGLAIADAVGPKNAAKYRVAESMARALRARHSLGPSGALLNTRIPYTQLDGRSALLLGWLKALAVKNPKQLAVSGTTIRDAGARQLLAHAAAKLPDDQAPHVALALVNAALAPKRNKATCDAWTATQQAARNGRKASVALAAAERAVHAVTKLGKSCSKKVRGKFSRPISLPAPTAEPRATAKSGGQQAGRPTQRSGDVYRKGVAFSAVAPVFKGYMDVPLVRNIVRRTRLNQVQLFNAMKSDQTGDTSIAILNATLWSRRLPPDRIADVAWDTILRRRNLLSRRAKAKTQLTVSQLKPAEAMVLGYARVVAGWGLERQEVPGDPAAAVALPRQLFRSARSRLPMTASLGPIMAMLHTVDLTRQASLCAAAKRADSVAFVAQKSQLPIASKRVVIAATDMVRSQCAAVRGAPK